jgi:ODP family beta-lactamase
MVSSYHVAPDIDVLTSNFPIPGYGFVPINAFVIKGSEPILVETGAAIESADFMQALRSVVDPADLRWIWLSHTDFDHIGSLHQLLKENPRLRVITTFLGMGIMGLAAPLPIDRVHFVNPGETVTLGNRTLTAVKPPVFDNPCTTGFYDSTSGILFSSDCFGALLQSVPQSAADLSERDLRDGQVLWATIDSPWLHKVDKDAFAGELDGLRKIAPKLILSNHLPPAPGHLMERFLGSLAVAPGAHAFVGPNQPAFEQMLKQMAAPV